ncbi:Death-associated protein kinase related [Nymphon striatum]|nr:Death-associated protein kinase related [Nymphon striatum]
MFKCSLYTVLYSNDECTDGAATQIRVAGGELQRILDEEEIIEERIVVRLMKQILEGVSYLHDNNIAHLDIKPQNLLLTAPFPDCNVQLCDFGISRLICGDVEIREIVGTPDYIAPEVLHYEPISVETDLWSIGILTYVLLSGHSPFGGDTKQETFCNITQSPLDFPPELFGNISSQAKDFIKSVLIRNPKLRPSVKECMTHSWLSGHGIDKNKTILSSSSCPVSPIPCALSDQSSSEIDEVDIAEAMSSETSSMDSSIPDTNDSCSEEPTTVVEENSVSSEMDTVNKLSDDNSSVKDTECASDISKSISKSNSNSSITREVFNISSAKPKSIDSLPILTRGLESPHRSQETNNSGRRMERLRGVFSPRNDNLNSSLLNRSFHDDNKENIRLTRTRVAPPPIIHSLTPSLNVRSGIVRNAITGFTSGRSMSTVGPGKSLSSLLSPPKTRTSSLTSKSTSFSSTFSSLGSKSSISSRKIRISADETELRISKTSVVVIDESVCF